MVALPLSLVTSLILGFLFLRLLVLGIKLRLVAALLGAVALQGIVITLAQHLGVETARTIQPVTALILPVLAWRAWTVDGLGRAPGRADALHWIWPLVGLGLRVVEPGLLDLLVPLTYAGYAAALALSLGRAGPDLPRGRLDQGAWPRLVWAGVAGALALSALSDIVIAGALVTGRADRVPLILAITTSLLLFGMGCLALVLERMSGRAPGATSDDAPEPTGDDQALFARLEDLMETRRPWRDPDLTLAQLARRLAVPAKRLSVAVNVVTGDNISRYVNTHRVRAACDALASGVTVTDAMLEAGFITKSNFNREFRRVTGRTPTEWRAGSRN